LNVRYVELGEAPVTAGIRNVKEQIQIIIPASMISSLKLIGTFNDPEKDMTEEIRSTITISYAIEYIASEMISIDGTNTPKTTNKWNELMTIPLEEVGTTYTQDHFEKDHFSYSVLINLKKQFNIHSIARQLAQKSQDDPVSHSTCY
jgi:ADP-ribose pyrophosphatase YjhB (NUDIX family)